MQSMEKLREQGMTKLILDLRGNPGGLLDQATMIADEFLSGDKLIVYTEGKSIQRKDYFSTRPGSFEEGELVLLIDQYSASASEILAGAIQDWDRGLIVGRRSFGKGLVQQEYEMEDESLLRLTIAKYFTPSGRSIQKAFSSDLEAYDNEVYLRFDHGEFFTPDSSLMHDSLKFETAGGRTVYGGGGIMPDVFVPLDTSLELELAGSIRTLAPEFSYNYYSHHRNEFDQYKTLNDFIRNFRIDDQLLAQFKAQLVERKLLSDLEGFDKAERYAREIIKAYIARQLWKNEGFYPIVNATDKVFLKAVELLRNGSLLSEYQ
jgi:carboxyl-terminal processing protease